MLCWKTKPCCAIIFYSSAFSLAFFIAYDVLWSSRGDSELVRERATKNMPRDIGSEAELVRSAVYYNNGSFSISAPHGKPPLNLTPRPVRNKESSFGFPTRMPFPDYVKSREEVEKSGWVTTLHNHLQTLDKNLSPHLNVVFGDSEHRLLVLNWATAALDELDLPLHNVLVLSLDRELCEFLTSRGFPLACIAVPIESLFSPRGGGVRRRGRWKVGQMVRLPLIRLINHWGYDVASYDSDAVLLGNPQKFYTARPDVHLFSSAGTFPMVTSGEWGFSLCAGAMLFRASPAVESLWESVWRVGGIRDEQVCLNFAVEEMEVAWNTTTSVSRHCSEREGWEGEGLDGIRVLVFPQNMFCRRDCCKAKMALQDLYLVHPFGSKRNVSSKVDALKRMNAWFINEDDI